MAILNIIVNRISESVKKIPHSLKSGINTHTHTRNK